LPETVEGVQSISGASPVTVTVSCTVDGASCKRDGRRLADLYLQAAVRTAVAKTLQFGRDAVRADADGHEEAPWPSVTPTRY